MTFSSQTDANSFFIEQKQQNLDTFLKFIRENMFFEPDLSPESLKAVEKLYFKLRKERKYKANFITIEDYELYMSVYFGEVIVKNLEGFKWAAERDFENPNAYSLVIKKSNYAKGISRRRNHYIQKNNKNQEALFREFLQEQKFA
jgi:hypothetical protein